MRMIEAEFAELARVLGVFHRDCTEDYLDAGAALDFAIGDGGDDDDLVLAHRQLQFVLDRAATEQALEREFERAGLHITLPAGNSWRTWGRYVLARLAQALSEPDTRPMLHFDFGKPPVPPAPSRFLDLETANDACTLVLRAHEARFRAWAEDGEGWYRLHLYADVGHVVGHLAAGPDQPPEAVTGVVVVMKRDFRTGQPFVLTTHPERLIDPGPRERWPDLPNLFGGYFGQDWATADGTTWVAQSNFQSSTKEPARSRAAAQLDELLNLDDADLAEAVVALGSYVVPRELRAWVARTRQWLDEFDWTARDDEEAAPPS